MKLLIFIYKLSSGGVERVAANLAAHWANRGWEVTLLTLASSSQDFYEIHPSVKRVALGLSGESSTPLGAAVANLQRILALRKVLRNVRPDVALAMETHPNVLLGLAATALTRVITIGSEHFHPPQYPLGFIWEKLRAHLYARLHAVVALTEKSGLWLRENTNAREIIVIPNPACFPLQLQEPHLDLKLMAGRGRILLAVGRLTPQKGFDLLIAAFARLAKSFPDWVLVIMGEGPERGNLEDSIKSYHLEVRVFLPSWAGNMGQWYNAADLFVMTSRFEGFPNALVEALAHGLPAVSFDCDTGPRDIIRHEVDGLLVAPGDIAAMESALNRMMNDECLRQSFAQRAIEVRERLSMTSVAGMWEGLFQRLSL